VKLEWSSFAFADRDDVFDYIQADSPRAALMVDDAIETAARRLLDFPERGRAGRISGTRELVVTGLPYIIVYRFEGTVIRILRVLHGAQQWPGDLLN